MFIINNTSGITKECLESFKERQKELDKFIKEIKRQEFITKLQIIEQQDDIDDLDTIFANTAQIKKRI